MTNNARQRKLVLTVAMCAVIVCVHFFADFSNNNQQSIISNFKQMNATASNDLVIIEIDDLSLNHFGVWPWPRSRYTDLLEKLEPVKPQKVAFYIDFSAKTTEIDDFGFSRTLKRVSYPVILPTHLHSTSHANLSSKSPDTNPLNRGLDGIAEHNESPETTEFDERLPLDQFAKYSLLANMNLDIDDSGLIFEYVTIAENNRPSLGALLANKTNTPLKPIQIDYSIDPASIPRISFIDILSGNFEASQISNKNVLIGITAMEIADLYALPKHGLAPGVLVHAFGFETLYAETNFVEVENNLILIIALLLFAILTMLHNDNKLVLPLAVASLAYAAIQGLSVYVHHNFHLIMPVSLINIAIAAFIFVQVVQNIKFRSFALFREYNRNNYNKALINQVITESFDGIIITDANGRILVANKKALQLFTIDNNYEKLPTSIFDYISGSQELLDKIKNSEITDNPNVEIVEREITNRYAQKYTVEMILRKSAILQYSDSHNTDEPHEIFNFTISDVSEKKKLIAAQQQSNKALYNLKNNDTLSRLPNRNSFNQRLDIAYAHQFNNESSLILLVNLDSLKEINGVFGVNVGDDVIYQTAQKLRKLVGEFGFVARYSDKVFGIIYKHESFDCDLCYKDLIYHIYALFDVPFKLSGHEIIMNVSIGAALAPHHGNTAEELLKNATLALEYAKLLDTKKWFLYEKGLSKKMGAKREIRLDIVRGLKNEEFVLFYQPQYDIVAGKLIGFESLVRWLDPIKGMRYPDEFIPVAEEFGLIDELGELVLNIGCRDAASWPNELTVAINVSAIQFKNSDMASLCSKYLTLHGLPANRLELEITESAMVDNMAHVVKTLAAIQKLGVKIAMDDFGTGYSSLQYLTELPIDKIKIDRSFIKNIGASKQSDALISTIIALGHSLDKQVLAEGIETENMALLLKAAGCSFGQGYYYGRPMPIDKVIDHIEDIDSFRKIG